MRLLVAAGIALGRAVRVFRVGRIGRWALAHAWENRSLIGPLATRALPFLLLFITFLFINTEVWQVSSALPRPLLWACVGIFALLAVAFLAPSFASEIERVGVEVEGERLAATCQGTPVASAAREILSEPHLATEVAGIRLPKLQRRNLMLMLFIAQAIQMLSLVVIVFGFFVVFGSIAIRPSVIEAWVGAEAALHGPVPPHQRRAVLRGGLPVGVRRPLLHRPGRHRPELPARVLHPDPGRPAARHRRPQGLRGAARPPRHPRPTPTDCRARHDVGSAL